VIALADFFQLSPAAVERFDPSGFVEYIPALVRPPRSAPGVIGFSIAHGRVTRRKGIAMLVISRARGDSIIVNDDITITVVEIRKDKVRLGVGAPKGVPVHRQEVYDAIYGHRQPISTEGDSRVPDEDEPVPDVIVELPLTQSAQLRPAEIA
jgi:carbon storage regulator